jgi:hypothetical protein
MAASKPAGQFAPAAEVRLWWGKRLRVSWVSWVGWIMNEVWAELLGICFFRSVPEDVVEEIGEGEKGGYLLLG